MRITFYSFFVFLALFPAGLRAQVDTSFVLPVIDSTYNWDGTETGPGPFLTEPVFDEGRKVEWNGYILTDDRLRFDDLALHWQEYRFDVRSQYRFGEKARFYGEIWVRGIKFTDVNESSDLMFANEVIPIDVDIREAYLDVYGLFTPNLDVRIGRQRVAWGTGDRFNPTDNLNPYDLEDIWDFGRHVASNGLQLNYYAGKWTFTAVGILQFTPSILPGSDWTPAFMPGFSVPGMIVDSTTVPGLFLPVYLQQGVLSDSVVLPRRDIKQSPRFGLRVKRSIGNWDLSLSYVYSRDPIPLPSRLHTNLNIDTIVISLPDVIYANATADVKVYLNYPVQKILGFDFAGSLWGMGLRGEAACFFPQKIFMKQTLHYEAPALGIIKDSLLPDSLILDNSPYVKFLLGLDYTFKNGIYINFQYLHGFLHERGNKELKDYFMFGADWNLLNSKLELSLLNTALQIGDWKRPGEQFAILYMPEITYRPVDNAEITLGAHIIDGKGDAGFARVHKNDDVFIRFKYSF